MIVTSLIGILVFTAATQQWFINKLRWYETIAFLIISLSFLAPDYVLGKFYPKFNEQKLSVESIQNLSFDPSKEIHIKVTRITGYGERYKLFVIDKGKFENNYNLEEYGISLVKQEENIVVDSENLMKIRQEFDMLLNNLSAFKSQITAVQNRVKGIEKQVRKEMKSLERKINNQSK